MTKTIKGLAVAIVVLFTLAVGVLAAVASQAPEQSRQITGGLERAVGAANEANLKVTAAMPTDLYGEEFIAAMIVCPGSDAQLVQETLGLPEKTDGLPEERIDIDHNYLVLVRADGTSAADAISRSRIDLCAAGQIPPFNTASLIPLIKSEEGPWVLAP